MSPEGEGPGGVREKGRSIERQVEIDASVEVVWKALTEAGELMRWFPPEARVNPGEGGSVWMKWDDLMEGEYAITAWRPNEHLQVGFPKVQAGNLLTDYYLEGLGGRTILRVVTSGFGEGDEWDDDFETVSSGWDFELASLHLYLERHRGKAHRVVHIRRHAEGPGHDVWNRLVGDGRFFASPQVERGTDLTEPIDVSLAGEPLTACHLIAWDPPRQVFGTIPGLGDALFRIEHLVLRGGGTVLVWLAAYDVADQVVSDIERRWNEGVDRALS